MHGLSWKKLLQKTKFLNLPKHWTYSEPHIMLPYSEHQTMEWAAMNRLTSLQKKKRIPWSWLSHSPNRQNKRETLAIVSSGEKGGDGHTTLKAQRAERTLVQKIQGSAVSNMSIRGGGPNSRPYFLQTCKRHDQEWVAKWPTETYIYHISSSQATWGYRWTQEDQFPHRAYWCDRVVLYETRSTYLIISVITNFPL